MYHITFSVTTTTTSTSTTTTTTTTTPTTTTSTTTTTFLLPLLLLHFYYLYYYYNFYYYYYNNYWTPKQAIIDVFWINHFHTKNRLGVNNETNSEAIIFNLLKLKYLLIACKHC